MLSKERKVALPQIYYNIYGNDLLGKLDSLQKRYYYLTDHLGSVRVTVKDTVGVPVDSWSDYYPFGKEARGSTTSNEPKGNSQAKNVTPKQGSITSGRGIITARLVGG